MYKKITSFVPVQIKRPAVLAARFFCKYLSGLFNVILLPIAKFYIQVKRFTLWGRVDGESFQGDLNDVLGRLKFKLSVVDFAKLHHVVKRRSLVFVENNALLKNYKSLDDLLVDARVCVVFRTKKDYLEYVDYLKINNLEDSVKCHDITYIPTIDSGLDEAVYGDSRRNAIMFSKYIRCCFGNISMFRKFSRGVSGIDIALSDRLVPWVRNVLYIEKYVSRNKIKTIYVLPSRVINTKLLAFYLSSSSKARVCLVSDCEENSIRDIRECVYRKWQPLSRCFVSRYNMSSIRSSFGRYLLFFCNLSDVMYYETIVPVLTEMSKKLKCGIVVFPNRPLDRYISDEYEVLQPLVCKDDLPGLSEFFYAFDGALDGYVLDGFKLSTKEALFRLYIAINAKGTLFRVLRDCFALIGDVDLFHDNSKVSALVSSPGRIWTSQFLVKYLKEVPSFEIQSGTLSRSRRFKRPNSKYVLAIEDFSKSVYVEYFRTDADLVEVVGSPRIDTRLSDIKRFTKYQSRRRIYGKKLRDKIICVATQPYGVDVMQSMVDACLRFLSTNCNYRLIISMHPSEKTEYEYSYRQSIKKFDLRNRAIVSHGNIYHNLNAADFVITYFSTAGLEAFCLGKQVLTYRSSSKAAVPFDLCSLGVARSFTTYRDLESLIVSGDGGVCLTEGLKRLRDGRSAERIVEYIINRIESQA
ncbi:hypothetical protein [Desulfuromonas acetoxidans]|uniref:Capsule polysaccharide biosynthesis n=1 Tax=Desulfuromonas acetoxidans (strain DSM 684 / 11070) TaxID=281689 RepID=Q1K180_DESA6|nr:hypothetical protein [Desulfuromonas acetoxidans]EAT16128.1 hypothetical protein Dace_1592 [Desulfuromonas acetoxidans DSM 684]MBF0646434.1 hypothetical protein [Desulfuromonas acetoxidans]NVD25519.1 hypothetical protein [Desulfuromonas acetoxidans]